MKYRISVYLALLLSTLSSFNALAADGTRGGGQFVNVDNHPELRDVMENCYWVPGNEWVAELPAFKPLMQTIAREHWYLAATLAHEASRLNVCVTSQDLKTIPQNEPDDLTIVPQDGKQVAIRLDQTIFLNEPLFKSSTPEMQALTATHEIMHSLIPMNTPQRNMRLKSMIAAIARNQATAMSVQDFAFQIKMNDLDIVLDPSLIADRADVEIALNEATPLEARATAADHALLDAKEENEPLRDNDKKDLMDMVSGLAHSLAVAIGEGNTGEIQRLLSAGAGDLRFSGFSANWYLWSLVLSTGNIESLKAVLSAGARFFPDILVFGSGKCADYSAFREDAATAVQVLLDAHAPVMSSCWNGLTGNSTYRYISYDEKGPLSTVLYAHRLDLAQRLVNSIPPDEKFPENTRSLAQWISQASKLQEWSIVPLLIAKAKAAGVGVCNDGLDYDGYPDTDNAHNGNMSLAILAGKENIVRLLLDADFCTETHAAKADVAYARSQHQPAIANLIKSKCHI